MAARRRCAKPSARATASIPPASSAARAPTRFWRCSTLAYVGPGDEGLYTPVRLPRLQDRHRWRRAARPSWSPETNLHRRRRRHARRGDAATKIVFLANPNNPTGTYLPFDEVTRLHAGLPPHVLLVLDAAYAEYVAAQRLRAGIELVATSRQCRDDAHLLEDLRACAACGSAGCYGPAHVIDALNRIRGPFNVNGAGHRGGHRGAGGRRPHVEAAHRAQRALAALARRARSRPLGLDA